MKRLLKIIYNITVECICRLKGMHVYISPLAHCNMHTTFEGNNRIGKNVVVSNSFIGKGTYIGANTNLCNCKIGRFCSIASYVKIITGKHPTNLVSTSPAFFSTMRQNGMTYANKQFFEEKDDTTIIKNDVWIGSDVKILSGVTINDGAVIGAGALVVKDVPPYAIVGGVPAKIIRYRFDSMTVEKLMKIKWWDKSEEWLKNNASYFTNVQLFTSTFFETVS